MAIYAVGDIQGCLAPLRALLEKINFNKESDLLISAGDLINRGPESLATIRFCKDLGDSFKMVLGNHDLHLLAVAEGIRKASSKDTIQEILEAPDSEEILHWLRGQPLLLNIEGYHIVHAGIPHIWSVDQAHSLGEEVSQAIQSDHRRSYFENMYGNSPDIWSDHLKGPERWRVITNYLTRMRFCSQKGQLELTTKDRLTLHEPFKPWFKHKRREKDQHIIFGHWAALKGNPCGPNLFALDTGYVWGGTLRLINLKTKQIFEQPQIN
ncbi:MAG: symmetrical bis(5'-nucleosyl)-tetraphosphatase [Porticoccaceae bacterium]|nr:symmetrical bis(5'-nucleosyl)-tetraphosphatase [Porticoccaceae bacterium]